jgi:hypothetical protein
VEIQVRPTDVGIYDQEEEVKLDAISIPIRGMTIIPEPRSGGRRRRNAQAVKKWKIFGLNAKDKHHIILGRKRETAESEESANSGVNYGVTSW